MKTQLTYRCYNEEGVQIDKIRTSSKIRSAKAHFRYVWSGYIKVTCDETNDQIISKN